MQYEIRSLGLGGILDQAIKLLKNHFKTLFGIVLFVYIPFGLVQAILTRGMDDAVTTFSIISWICTVIMALSIWPLAQAATILAVSEFYVGRQITAVAAVKRAFGMFLPLIGVTILYFLGVIAVSIPAIGGVFLMSLGMPGILAGVVLMIIGLFLGIYFLFSWYLCTQVLVVERVGVKSFARSRKLMKNNFGKAFALGFIVGVISVGLGAVAMVIPEGLVQAIAAVFVNAITVLFGAAAGVVFYFSARCQHEQFDLEMLAETVGREIPAPEPALVP